MTDEQFVEKYEELLNKGYCNCNEMNCIDNNSPRRILDIVKNLQQENKELSRIVANKVISDYDIDTPLKTELGEARLKIVSLEDALHCYKQEKEDLIKWLEDTINWTAKKANIDEKWKSEYKEHQKICWWINHARMDILDRIKDSNYE